MKRSSIQLVPRAPVELDSEVLARVARGDMAALGCLYDRYAVEILRFVRRASFADDAEDIVQNTFLRAARIAGTFDPAAVSARPWLFAIAARLLQERKRSVRRFAAAMFGLANQRRTASSASGESSTDFERALATLSEPKRIVMVLAEVEGFTCEEIGLMLEVPVGTVWTRLHHARRELRSFFAEDI